MDRRELDERFAPGARSNSFYQFERPEYKIRLSEIEEVRGTASSYGTNIRNDKSAWAGIGNLRKR